MDYFDESYSTENKRWDIDIKRISNDQIHVAILNNSLNNTRYSKQYVITIDKDYIEWHTKLPKYLEKELLKIKDKYFKSR